MNINDLQLRRDVEAELDWDARLDSRQIGVAVKNGVVALSGHVGSYAERRAAEEAAKSVGGVRAVANDILIELPTSATRTDAEIAEAAVAALQANVAVPAERIRVCVREGWIALEGEVSLWVQRNAAETAVSSLPGVKGISNGILISAEASAEDVRSQIEDAFRRRAQLDARNIRVSTAEGTVTLEGEVHSWQEREQAETAAWQARGVSRVIDNLKVRA
ncbi:MAG TPA: BON domain-containing protein [Steroidobacteraceae bacterium]|nr:BON domain-containing protein [Steroidobacteraceae bacterium]